MNSPVASLAFAALMLIVMQPAHVHAATTGHTQQIKQFFNGETIQVTYREGGPIYGTLYVYETRYCASGRYHSYVYSEKQTVLDNQQINRWEDQGTWDVITYGGQVGLGFRSNTGELNFVPVHIRADGTVSLGEGVSIIKKGHAQC